MQINWKQQFYNNTLQDYLYVLAAMIVLWIVLQLVKRWLLVLVRRLSGRTTSSLDDVLVSAVERFLIPYVYLVLNIAIINQLNLSARANHILDVASTVITVVFAARIINHIIHFSLQLYMHRRAEGPARMQQLSGILVVIKIVIWILGFLFFLDNIGYDVTTVIAGLGVGGIAIALAAQNILGDLFSYFVIFFDKPFEVGDFIVVGSQSGTVERIGIKTSQMRSGGGEQLIMPNAELVRSPINNFKRLEQRRVVFKIGVAYETSVENLQAIPSIIQAAINANAGTKVERVHLQALAESAINYEASYLVLSSDYNLFMDTHQAVCLQILRQFRQLGIEIAYPTRKVVVSEEDTPATKSAKPASTIITIENDDMATGAEKPAQ